MIFKNINLYSNILQHFGNIEIRELYFFSPEQERINVPISKQIVSEFIRTNVVMNNIDAILEWISNLLSQVKQRIEDGEIEMNGEMRER